MKKQTQEPEGLPVIQVKHAGKRFRKQQVLKDISVSFVQGEICGIVGHDGSSKTVLFKCICGLLYLDEGNIYIHGRQMHEDIDMLNDAGVIIEETSILGNTSGYKNLDYLYRIRNTKNKEHLILDEPMNGLDKIGVADMRKLFLELREQGKTIILASHNKEDIDVLCDHVYEMEMGVLSKIR